MWSTKQVSGFLLIATNLRGAAGHRRPPGPMWGITGQLPPAENRAKSTWANSRVEGPTGSWDLIKLNCIWDIWLKWERQE